MKEKILSKYLQTKCTVIEGIEGIIKIQFQNNNFFIVDLKQQRIKNIQYSGDFSKLIEFSHNLLWCLQENIDSFI